MLRSDTPLGEWSFLFPHRGEEWGARGSFKVMLVSRVCSCMGRSRTAQFFASLYFWTFLSMWQKRENSPVTSVSRYLFFPCAPSVNKSTRVLEEATPFLPPSPSLLFFLFYRSRDTPSRGMKRSLLSCSVAQPERSSLKPTRLQPRKQTSLSPHASSSAFPLCAGGHGHCSTRLSGAEIQVGISGKEAEQA